MKKSVNLPRFFVGDAICSMLFVVMDSECGSDDGNTGDIEDDLIDGSELNLLYAGSDNDDYYKKNAIDDLVDII